MSEFDARDVEQVYARPDDRPIIVVGSEASYWWRKNDPLGVLLSTSMWLFVIAPIALVLKRFYGLSFFVFSLMVPYGLLLRYLAVRAVRNHLKNHPEEREEFEQSGIISG